MSIVRAEITALSISPKGVSPTGVPRKMMKIRKPAVFTVDPFNGQKDHMDREWENMSEAKLEVESFHSDYDSLSDALKCCGALSNATVGADAQIQTPSGVYKFEGDYYFGYDFEMTMSEKEATIKHMLNMADDKSAIDLLLSEGKSNSFDYGDDNTVNPNLLIKPVKNKLYFYSTEESDALITSLAGGVKDFKLSIKSVGNKTAYQRSIPHKIGLSLEVNLIDNDKNALYDYITKEQIWGFKIAGSNSNLAIIVDQYVVALNKAVKIGDEERLVNLKFTGSALLTNIAGNAGAYSITFSE